MYKTMQAAGWVLIGLLSTSACAVDSSDEFVGEPESGSTQPQASHASDFPPGARIVDVDEDMSVDEVLAVLAQRNNDKAPFQVSCANTIFTIQSADSHEYVSLDADNILKANVSRSYAEWFRLCTPREGTGLPSGGSSIVLWSLGANAFVAAEFGWGGGLFAALRARTTGNPDVWELFQRVVSETGWGDGLRITGPGGTAYWVSGEFHYTGTSYGMLRARNSNWHMGMWELWHFVRL